MALNPNASAAQGVYKAVTDSMGLFGSTNKAKGRPLLNSEDELDEYESSFSDEEILGLTISWLARFNHYYEKIRGTQKKAFDYWLGNQPGSSMLLTNATAGANTDMVDNVIFPMVETLIPIVTRANPDPVITADPTPEGQSLARALYAALIHEADRQKLKRKLARTLREWCWNRLGVIKSGWDYETKKIKTDVINAQNMIFDTDGYVDEGGLFCGAYIGEKKKMSASKLAEMFPKKKKIIEGLAGGHMATQIEYIEWWYCGTDVFFVIGDANVVLGKFKNPYWNYDYDKSPRKSEAEQGVAQIEADESSEKSEEEEEEEEKKEANIVRGLNFVDKPREPYFFLSIFSSGREPYDETNLILQNISAQDTVNRRIRQIDKNVNGMNVGLVVSGKSFTDEQATIAANSLLRGDAISVPDGNVENGVKRFPPESIPDIVYHNLEDMRQEILNVSGVGASTSQGVGEQKTVRGKIIVQQSDLTRLSLITENLEQLVDSIYNWWTQLMLVFWEEEQFFVSAGSKEGAQLLSIKNGDFAEIKSLNITVKEGSAIPKDPLTKRNEAIDLWQAKGIGALKFFERLGEANPSEMTKDLIMWNLLEAGKIDPSVYLPSIQQELPPQPAAPGTPPGQPPQIQAGPGQGAGPGSPSAIEQEISRLQKSVPIPNV